MENKGSEITQFPKIPSRWDLFTQSVKMLIKPHFYIYKRSIILKSLYGYLVNSTSYLVLLICNSKTKYKNVRLS